MEVTKEIPISTDLYIRIGLHKSGSSVVVDLRLMKISKTRTSLETRSGIRFPHFIVPDIAKELGRLSEFADKEEKQKKLNKKYFRGYR